MGVSAARCAFCRALPTRLCGVMRYGERLIPCGWVCVLPSTFSSVMGNTIRNTRAVAAWWDRV